MPTPCIASRADIGDDIKIVVLTADASAWNFGLAGPVTDLTAPVVSIDTPADAAEYVLGANVPADFDCADEPGGSGLASCVGPSSNGQPIDTTTIGPKTFRVDAADVAGNSSTLTHTYRVAWPFAFVKPIAAQPAVTKVKAGEKLAIKFTLGGDRGLAVLAAGSPGSGATACPSGAALGPIESIVMSSPLTYKKNSKTYILEWKTSKAWAHTCRRLELRLADGSVHYADIKFSK